ncbi:MAG: S41 family peptidase [Gemmatimonadaceae bacterium]
MRLRHAYPIALLSLAESASALGAQSLDGVWKTQGYGYVIRIAGDTLSGHEVTRLSCLPSFTATRDTTRDPAREATFQTPDGNVFFVRSGGERDHRRLHFDGAASDMRIDRIPSMPSVCSTPTADTPLVNFDVFATTWADHYILFDQKHVDWAAVVASNRAKITASTTPTELFDVLEGMIKPFDDAHTFIGAPSLKRTFSTLRPSTQRVFTAFGGREQFRKVGMPKLLGIIDQHYLKGPVRSWCNDQVQYGHLNDSTGYLRILSFNGFAKEPLFIDQLKALQVALDTVFSDAKLRSLVIDVRINFGGADPLGLEIASRLATAPYLAYTKEARADPNDRNRWTPGDQNSVRRSSRPGFRGPVVELTGGLTISAGETFTQALMGRMPHITRIGENTQGVFSDVLVRRLPNGWRFGLPNEVFRAPDGKTFDGPGIPPDITVPVFADADVAANRDPGIEKALEVLASMRH